MVWFTALAVRLVWVLCLAVGQFHVAVGGVVGAGGVLDVPLSAVAVLAASCAGMVRVVPCALQQLSPLAAVYVGGCHVSGLCVDLCAADSVLHLGG